MTRLAVSFVIFACCRLLVHGATDDVDAATVSYDGELLLAAVLPLRTRDSASGRPCGPVQLMQGLRSLEALFVALDWLNNATLSPVKLPFRLGAIAYDCCQNAQVAVENSVNLILPSMVSVFDTARWNSSAQAPPLRQVSPGSKVVGVLGGADSEVSIALASVFSPLKMPQISFLSTSRELSNKHKFKFFLRTVPNDTHAGTVILNMLLTYNWSVISGVFDDTNYGIRAYTDFERKALRAGICISVRERLIRSSAEWSTVDYEAVISKLVKKSQARVVVLYLSTGTLNEFLRAAQKFKAELSDIVWIGTDSWLGSDELYKESSRFVTTRSIVLTPRVTSLPEGYGSFRNRKLPSANPWLTEYQENRCNCTFNSSDRFKQAGLFNNCDLQTDCLRQVWFEFGEQPQLQYVLQATLAFAYSLKLLYESYNCSREHFDQPLCEAMQPDRLDRQALITILRELEFPYGNQTFRFYDGVDGTAEYSILFWDDDQWVFGSEANSSGFHWDSMTEQFTSLPLLQVASRCEVCGPRQVRWVVEDTCCWTCVNCSANQIVIRSNWSASTIDRHDYKDDSCYTCAEGSYVNYAMNQCVKYADVTINYSSWQAVPVLLMCVLGLLITALTAVCFWKYRNTPVVKACGRETSVFLLLAAALSYLAPFVIVSPPDPLVCWITRCAAGLCQTLAYAAMFTKALRIAVIFSARQAQSHAARYCTARFQAYAILTLMGVETLIELAWLVYEPSRMREQYDNEQRSYELVCAEISKTYTIMLIVPACILLLAAVFAFRIRKTPDGFNEAKSLGFVIYTNCALMAAVLPALVSSSFAYKLRIISLCILLHFSASSILYGLLLPKVYICVFRPQKNTKQAVMNRARTFTSVGTLSGPGSHVRRHGNQSAASLFAYCVGLYDQREESHEQMNCAAVSREKLDGVNNAERKSALSHHSAACACKCKCCAEWDKLADEFGQKRHIKLLCPGSVHFEVFDDESSASKQAPEHEHAIPPCENSNEISP